MTAAAQGALPAVAVGGGLAGAAFALELARNGQRVIVLERARGPHHKVCGEFLSEEAQTILRCFGIEARAFGATSVTRLRIARGERQATVALPFSAAGFSRLRLDELLLLAAERAGAVVIRGARVMSIEPKGEAITVRGEHQSWRAAAVALATGKHSLRGLAPRPGTMVGFKVHLESQAAAQILPGVVQLVFFHGGYVGACLVEHGILSLGWVIEGRLLRAVGSSWAAQRRYLVRQSSLVGELLERAHMLFARPLATAAIPYGFLRSQPIASAIYAVGDQLAVVPSFTGDGIAIALYSGLAAARALLKGQTAQDYQRELIAPLRGQFRLARGIGRLLDMPATSPMMIAAARFLPSLVAGLAEATRLRISREIAAVLPPPGKA